METPKTKRSFFLLMGILSRLVPRVQGWCWVGLSRIKGSTQRRQDIAAPLPFGPLNATDVHEDRQPQSNLWPCLPFPQYNLVPCPHQPQRALHGADPNVFWKHRPQSQVQRKGSGRGASCAQATRHSPGPALPP